VVLTRNLGFGFVGCHYSTMLNVIGHTGFHTRMQPASVRFNLGISHVM